MLKSLSVSELSYYITSIFDAEELLHGIKVYGEVSNLSCVRGNLYFNLKDENALVPCIMFGSSSNSIKEGDQILATGSMRYYGKGGKLNFYITSFVPYGSGILYQKFLELKNKLEQEGVFSAQFKKDLPKTISTIGVITSETGAVIHDIQTVSHRRNPSLNIIVYPAKVQGDGAEQTIIKGLKTLDKIKDVDVIIIARGGGSIEDLQPFNTEVLAREIIKTNKPVISAVGHETDFTICDFASSIRAATPSVAAELVSRVIFDDYKSILNNLDKISYLVLNLIDAKESKLDVAKLMLIKIVEDKMRNGFYNYNSLINKLYGISNKLLTKQESDLTILTNKLQMLNPLEVLNKGYVKVSKNNKSILSKCELTVGEDVLLEFKDGSAVATINNV